jgi:hypothetical protein
MPAKLTTTINKIKTVPNPINAETIGQFYHYMKCSNISENHQNNCLKVVIALANFLGTDTTFYDIKNKEQITALLGRYHTTVTCMRYCVLEIHFI